MDILFFWVARMVMMGLHLTGKLPFHTVYLHAMVRDKYGRKMSKSLGNVIDPMEVINGCKLDDLLVKIDQGNLPAAEIEKAKTGQKNDFPDGIPECGADALRFGLLAYTIQGRDVNLDIKRVVGYRQFCNKIWNAVRFALTYVDQFQPTSTMHLEITSLPGARNRDRAVLCALNNTIEACHREMGSYTFGAVCSALHSFFLYDFCDVYLELIKPVISIKDADNMSAEKLEEAKELQRAAQTTLYTCLEQYLRLLHPLMPFVTEELWQRLPNRTAMTSTKSIVVAKYPEVVPAWNNPKAIEGQELIKSCVHAGRSLRTDYKIPNHTKANFYYRTDKADVLANLKAQEDDFCTLARGALFQHLSSDAPNPNKNMCIKVINESLSLLVDLTGLIDIDAEIARLKKEQVRITPFIEQYKRKMNAEGYATKVPANVQATNTEKLANYETELATTMAAIESFEKMKL